MSYDDDEPTPMTHFLAFARSDASDRGLFAVAYALLVLAQEHSNLNEGIDFTPLVNSLETLAGHAKDAVSLFEEAIAKTP